MGRALEHVVANGLKFAYFAEGAGPLVLFLHGFPDTAKTWDFVLPRVAAKGYRAVAPYMRGYAPTEIPKDDASQRTIAEDALALIDALGEKEAILVGHDWGASAVYGAVSLAPEKVKKLVAVGIPHPATLLPTPKKVWGVRHFMAYKMPGAARRFAANDFAALPAIYKRWSPTWSPAAEEFDDVRRTFADAASCDAAFGYYRALSFLPERALAKRTNVPTVVFYGEDDPITDASDYARGKKMFGGPYAVESLPGGHFVHRESPERFAARLLAHL